MRHLGMADHRRRRSSGAGVEPLESRTLLSVTPLVLATLDGSTGPAAPRVAVDAAGDVFGTTLSVGDSAGTVYEIPAGTHAVRTLASFGSSDPSVNTLGIDPGDILIDKAGDLFGDATTGGSPVNSYYVSNGTLWELPAGASAVRVLHTFPPLGIFPASSAYGPTSLSMDSAGDLFGSAEEVIVHPYGAGSYAFEYVAASGTTRWIYGPGGGYASLYANVASSPAGDAYVLEDSPFFDPIGVSLIRVPTGTTTLPSGTLATFATPTGVPVGSPVPVGVGVDAVGDAFVTVAGSASDTITEVAAGASQPTVRATLRPIDGKTFVGNPIVDAAGDVFAVTSAGGAHGYGTLVELPAGASAPELLMSFTSADENEQVVGLTVDAAGNLFGTMPTASGVAVFELRGVGIPAPDPANTSALTPLGERGTVPTHVVAGAKVRGTVTVTLDDTAAAATKGPATVNLYAVTAGQAAADGVRVGSARYGRRLAGGRSARVAVAVRPVTLPDGSYTLVAVVTDATGGTSTAITGPAVVVAPPNIALSAVVTKLSTAAVTPGGPLSFTVTVTNSGNVNSVGTASLAVHLSVDGTAHTVLVPSHRGVPRSTTVKAGRAVSFRVTVTVPAAAAAMDLYPLVAFAQDGQTATAAATTTVTVG